MRWCSEEAEGRTDSLRAAQVPHLMTHDGDADSSTHCLIVCAAAPQAAEAAAEANFFLVQPVRWTDGLSPLPHPSPLLSVAVTTRLKHGEVKLWDASREKSL